MPEAGTCGHSGTATGHGVPGLPHTSGCRNPGSRPPSIKPKRPRSGHSSTCSPKPEQPYSIDVSYPYLTSAACHGSSRPILVLSHDLGPAFRLDRVAAVSTMLLRLSNPGSLVNDRAESAARPAVAQARPDLEQASAWDEKGACRATPARRRQACCLSSEAEASWVPDHRAQGCLVRRVAAILDRCSMKLPLSWILASSTSSATDGPMPGISATVRRWPRSALRTSSSTTLRSVRSMVARR